MVVFWSTSVAEEIEVLRDVVAKVEVDPVKARDVSWDQFSINLSRHEQPSIQNDVITINRRSSSLKVKLAISYALAQSTKLIMYEKEVCPQELLSQIPAARSLTITDSTYPAHFPCCRHRCRQLRSARGSSLRRSRRKDTPAYGRRTLTA